MLSLGGGVRHYWEMRSYTSHLSTIKQIGFVEILCLISVCEESMCILSHVRMLTLKWLSDKNVPKLYIKR